MLKKADKIYFLVLYIAFFLCDMLGIFGLSNALKFAFIFSAFLWAAIYNKRRFIKAALGLTVVCDFFLLFTPYYDTGIFVFCLVMCVYIYGFTKKALVPVLLLGFSLALAAIITPQSFPPVAIAYAILFYSNLFFCIKHRENFVLPIAFILFALCDIFVALFNITQSTALMVPIWLFYAPSQYIISHYATR